VTALDTHAHGHHHGHSDNAEALRPENINLAPGAGKGLSVALLALGAILAVAGVAMAYLKVGGVWPRQAVAAYLVAALAMLAVCLGATFFVMVFHLLNAGWTATLRRQFENVMTLTPLAWLMVLPALVAEVAADGRLYMWMNDSVADSHLLHEKAPYFFWPLHVDHGHSPFPAFWALRTILYGAFWFFITSRLMGFSRAQDADGRVEHAARARFTSAWALPLFAISIAFAAFDYLMSLDYSFFSTMWGVWYFAGAAFSSCAVIILVFAFLTRAGKLRGAVTKEHFHDLGKLLFSFTVFWAYISFSQYFLIWYSNIPEETAFFLERTQVGSPWRPVGITLMIGHFIAPFLIVLFRGVKRNPAVMIAICLWCLAMHVLDIYFMARPVVYGGPLNTETPSHAAVIAVDLLVIVGVVAVFFGLLIRKVASGPLVAVNDPYMSESLEHKNYV